MGAFFIKNQLRGVKATDFICVIEIPKGSKTKYELDKETAWKWLM